MSDRGICRPPTSLPIRLSAAFTGIGFTSQKSASHRPIARSCSFLLPATSPSRNFWQISWVCFGATLDSTEITPIPPSDMIGTIWSSLPEYRSTLSPARDISLAICPILPLASLMPTIFSTSVHSLAAVCGWMLHPVRLGTL